MKQYNQHPDNKWCTYYASATAIARDCLLELSYDDLKAIAKLMERYRYPWTKSYSIETTSNVVIKYIKDFYNKDIWFKRVNVYQYDWDATVLFSSKIDTSYILDLKDGIFNWDMPTKWEDHVRCLYKDKNWDRHIVENFLWILPHNDILIGKRIPKWIKTVWYIYYNK